MNTPLELRETLVALREVRSDDDIIVTTMAAAREWIALGPLHPLDMVFVPSSMGQATSLGLGLALARPDLRVVVCNGDGSMLMNIGSLVTITAQAPRNLVVIVFENGVYEVTGAQSTPGASASRATGESVDFAGIARSCGFSRVLVVDDASQWRAQARSVMDADGPTFVLIRVSPVPGAMGPRSPGPGGARAAAFRDAVALTRRAR